MLTWTSKKQPIEDSNRNVTEKLVYVSACTRYAIVRMKKGLYHLRESDGCGGAYYVHTVACVSLFEAKLQAEYAENVRNSIWHYFVEMGQKRFDDIKETLSQPLLFSQICEYSQNKALSQIDWDVERHANDIYSYKKYRAFLGVDPAAYGDWKAMVEGRYVHWWEKAA